MGGVSGAWQPHYVPSGCTFNVMYILLKQEVEVGHKTVQDNCYRKAKRMSVKKRQPVDEQDFMFIPASELTLKYSQLSRKSHFSGNLKVSFYGVSKCHGVFID